MDIDAIQDFYLMEALWHARIHLPMKPATDRWLADAIDWKNQLTTDLALAMRDYLFLACCGEARYSRRGPKQIIPEINDMAGHVNDRDRVYRGVIHYSVEKNIDQLFELFTQSGWSGNMGGTAWATIAQAVTQYGKWPDAMFIDYVVDLEHNNGTVFNKPTSHVQDFSINRRFFESLKHWLDFKTIENIIDNEIDVNYIRVKYYLTRPFSTLDRTSKSLYERFWTIQRKPLPTYIEDVEIRPRETRTYEPVKWGNNAFSPTLWITYSGSNPFDPECCDQCCDAYWEWEKEHVAYEPVKLKTKKETSDNGQEKEENPQPVLVPDTPEQELQYYVAELAPLSSER